MKLRNIKAVYFAVFIFFTAILASLVLTSETASQDISLTFAGDIDYPPYSFELEGVPQGYSIDLIKVLAAIINKDITIKLMPWEKCLEEIEAGNVDGLIGALADKKQKKYIDYSEPVCEIEYAIFVGAKTRHINSMESLEGTLVGVRENCYILKKLEKNKRITLVKTRTILDALHKLKSQEITAVIAEKNAVLYTMQQNDLGDIRIAAPVADLIYPYSIAVKKGSRELLKDIDRGIAVLKEKGVLQKLNRKWFGTYLIKTFPWQTVTLMTAKITGALLALLILLWVVSLKATIKLKAHEIQRMSNRMIEKEKLTVLGKMAGQIAHELRTPLGIMKNSVYLLRKEDPSNRKLFEKRLHMLEDKIKLSSDILESILSYSRVKAEAPSEVSVKECLGEVLKDAKIPKDIKTDIAEEGDVPLMVYMDFRQFYSVLRNLVLNALQAMKDTGTLSIKTFLSDHENKVNIRICDTGRGIEESAKNKIFNLFYSTKDTGTGLGLSISKSIVEANEGKLRLEESGEKGTCFILTLPCAKPPKKKAE